jgi:hypothetical protein
MEQKHPYLSGIRLNCIKRQARTAPVLICWNKKAENYLALLHMRFPFIIDYRMGLFG